MAAGHAYQLQLARLSQNCQRSIPFRIMLFLARQVEWEDQGGSNRGRQRLGLRQGLTHNDSS